MFRKNLSHSLNLPKQVCSFLLDQNIENGMFSTFQKPLFECSLIISIKLKET